MDNERSLAFRLNKCHECMKSFVKEKNTSLGVFLIGLMERGRNRDNLSSKLYFRKD